MKKKKNRKIIIRYSIETDYADMEMVAKMIDIQPFSTRSSFPRGSIAKPWWETEVISDSLCVEKPLSEMIDRLNPKIGVIQEVINDFNASATLLIMVRSNFADRPVFSISPSYFQFFEALSAELIIDVERTD